MDTDDLYTLGTVRVIETHAGCGGELCPDQSCYACRTRAPRTIIAIHPIARGEAS